jgi:hypothetical protein
MKTSRSVAVIATLCLLSLIFGVAFNSIIWGDEKPPKPTMDDLVLQLQDLKAEIRMLKARITGLEAKQRQHEREHSVRQPGIQLQPEIPPPSIVPAYPQMPKGSVRKEINGMTYYIIPLQNQNANKSRQ